MDFVTGLILIIVGVAVGYGFRGQIGKLFGKAGKDATALSATAKLDAVKAKTDIVQAAVNAHTVVVNDLHTAVEDLAKKL
jgi:hypothetical protein